MSVTACHLSDALAVSAITDDDRRASHRVRTIYRVARVEGPNDEGLARVRNISDGGIKLETGLAIKLGDSVRVSLSETLILTGCVVWINGRECGLKFDQAIDSFGLLRQLVEEARSESARAIRLPARVPVTVEGLHQPVGTQAVNISQAGIKIADGGHFTPGLRLKIKMPSGIEKAGVVRWAKNNFAGIMLVDQFSVEELNSISVLKGGMKANSHC